MNDASTTTPPAVQCACGAPVAILTTSECRPCYARRWQRARRDARLATACACGSPAAIAKTQECRDCHAARLRTERAARARAAGRCVTCGQAPVHAVRTRQCRWCAAIERPLALSYLSCHSRVRSWRGVASSHTCPCGETAAEWAYKGEAAKHRISGVLVRQGKRKHMTWSPDPADYDALCRRCHGHRDRDNYGAGYRNNPAERRARAREWSARHYARTVATEAGREAYRARKRAEKRRRAQTAD